MKLRDRQIEVFQAIIECGTLTAAAERLCITQPSVSRILSRFEQVSGFKSFELKGRRLVPTEAAMIFYREVIKIQKGMNHLNNVAEEIRNFRRGYISIGILPSLSNSWIVDLSKKFSQQHPDIQLSLLQKSSKDITEAIEMQRIDIGISLLKSESEAVKSIQCSSLEGVCVLPKDHVLCEKEFIQVSDLKHEKCISLLNAEQSPASALDNEPGINKINNAAHIKTTSALTACRLVAEKCGISILPAIVAKEHSHLDIEFRPLKSSKKKPVYLLKSTNRPYSPSIEVFENLIIDKDKQPD